MPTVRRTPRAKRDLGRIVEYIADQNVSAAITWLDQVEAVFRLLAAQPEMGQRGKTRRFKQSRFHAFGSYIIYYWPLADGVEIIRVVHAARDQRRLL